MPKVGQSDSSNMQIDITPYKQRCDKDTLYIEAFGPVTSLDLTEYCNSHPSITRIIVQCEVPAAVRKIKAYLQRPMEIRFEKTKPSTCFVDIPAPVSKKRKEIEPLALQPPKPSQTVLPIPVAQPTSSKLIDRPVAKPVMNTGTTQFTLSKPLVRPTSTTISYQTKMANHSRSSESSVSASLSDDVTDESQVLAAMGYRFDEYRALVQKDYQLESLPTELRAVTQKLAELKRTNFRKNNKVARIHQMIGLSEYLDAYSRGKKNALFEYATGSGKTFMFSILAKAFLEAHQNNALKNKVIILVPMLNLRDQTEECVKDLNYSVVLSHDDLERESRSTTAKVIIMTYHLAFVESKNDVSGVKRQQMQALFAKSNLVVMDEAHSAISYFNNADNDVKLALNTNAVLAFTATPQFNLVSASREDNDAMKLVGHSRDENPITPFNIVAAIKSKANCPVKNFVVMLTSEQATSGLNANVDCDSKSVEQLIDSPQYNRMAADILINGVDDKNKPFRERKSIAFCANIQHANNMSQMINGIPNVNQLIDPDESKRMNYAYNLIKNNSELEYQTDEISALIKSVGPTFKSKISSDSILNQCKTIINSSNRAGPRSKSLALQLITQKISEAKATFKVAAAVHSKSNTRTQDQEQYKLGGVWFLFGDKMLDTGFDDPATSNVFRIKPTNSIIKSIQGCGRGARLDPDDPNKVCTIIEIDLGLKGQKFFYENLGLDEGTHYPNMSLGDVSRQPQYTGTFVRHTWAEPVPAYTLRNQFSGAIELNFNALRKELRQKEALDAIRAPNTSTRVILGATIERFNQTLLSLDELNKKLRAKVATAEIKVTANPEVATSSITNAMKLDEDVANASTPSNKKPRNPRRSDAVDNVRITRDMKAQMKQGVSRAQEIIETINEFFAMLDADMQPTSSKFNAKKAKKSAVQHTSTQEINIDKELIKFQNVAERLASMVNKLNALIKADSKKPNSSMNATTNAMLEDVHAEPAADAERAALLDLIENLNEIDNSSILSDDGINRVLQVQQRRRDEEAQQKRAEEQIRLEQELEQQRQQQLAAEPSIPANEVWARPWNQFALQEQAQNQLLLQEQVRLQQQEQLRLYQQQMEAQQSLLPQPLQQQSDTVQVQQRLNAIPDQTPRASLSLLKIQKELEWDGYNKKEALLNELKSNKELKSQLIQMNSTLTENEVITTLGSLRERHAHTSLSRTLNAHPELLNLKEADDFFIDAFRSAQVNVLELLLEKKPKLATTVDRDGNHPGILLCLRRGKSFSVPILHLLIKLAQKQSSDKNWFFAHVNHRGMNMFHAAVLIGRPSYWWDTYKIGDVLLNYYPDFENQINEGLSLLKAGNSTTENGYAHFVRMLEEWKPGCTQQVTTNSLATTAQNSAPALLPRNNFFYQPPMLNDVTVNHQTSSTTSTTNPFPQSSSVVANHNLFFQPSRNGDNNLPGFTPLLQGTKEWWM